MKIAIVGSSKLTYLEEVAATQLIDHILYDYRDESPIIVSGGARGVDSIAETLARQFNYPTAIYLPRNPRWEPEGYKERNLKIAEMCDVLHCIRSLNSKTYGSGWTADQAEKLGKDVRRYYV